MDRYGLGFGPAAEVPPQQQTAVLGLVVRVPAEPQGVPAVHDGDSGCTRQQGADRSAVVRPEPVETIGPTPVRAVAVQHPYLRTPGHQQPCGGSDVDQQMDGVQETSARRPGDLVRDLDRLRAGDSPVQRSHVGHRDTGIHRVPGPGPGPGRAVVGFPAHRRPALLAAARVHERGFVAVSRTSPHRRPRSRDRRIRVGPQPLPLRRGQRGPPTTVVEVDRPVQRHPTPVRAQPGHGGQPTASRTSTSASVASANGTLTPDAHSAPAAVSSPPRSR